MNSISVLANAQETFLLSLVSLEQIIKSKTEQVLYNSLNSLFKTGNKSFIPFLKYKLPNIDESSIKKMLLLCISQSSKSLLLNAFYMNLFFYNDFQKYEINFLYNIQF